MYSDIKLPSTFQFVEDWCMVWKKFHALLFLSHFNDSSTYLGYCKSLPHLSNTNFRNVFWYEIIFHISVCGRFLYSWEKFYALLFLSHFNQSSIPVGYWKSLPHLSWTYFRNVFEYEIIFHISVLLFLPHFNNSSTPVGYCKSHKCILIVEDFC